MRLVTAPHSLCVQDGPYHSCDYLSGVAGSRLASVLPRSRYFPATLPRPYIDLNRIESRATPYRREVDQALNEASLLIDVHSFPEPEFDGVEVAILDNFPGTWYGVNLTQFLAKNFIRVGYYYGDHINDIVLVARDRGVPAILVEYNEGLLTERIDQINRVIVSWTESMGN